MEHKKTVSTFLTKYETKQRFRVGHTFTSCTSRHPFLKLTANRTPHRILMCCPSKQTLALVLLAGSKRSRRPTSFMTTRTRTPHPVTCAIGVSRTACIYMSFDETFERGTKVYRFSAKTFFDGAPASTSFNTKSSEFQQFLGGVFRWSSGCALFIFICFYQFLLLNSRASAKTRARLLQYRCSIVSPSTKEKCSVSQRLQCVLDYW